MVNKRLILPSETMDNLSKFDRKYDDLNLLNITMNQFFIDSGMSPDHPIVYKLGECELPSGRCIYWAELRQEFQWEPIMDELFDINTLCFIEIVEDHPICLQ